MHKSSVFRKVNKIMAYVYMPLFFSFISLGVVYYMNEPLISVATSAAGLFFSDDVPDFSVDYNNIFHPGSVDVSVDNTVKKSEITFPTIGDLYANLTCPEIGLDTPVYWGDSYAITRKGAGHNASTYLPGFGGYSVICAHNNSHFAPLQGIELDDILTLETSYGVYKYQVTKANPELILGKIYTDFISVDETESIMLFTCYPFTGLADHDYRFIVCADLISGPEVVEE